MSNTHNGGPAFPIPGLHHDEDFNGMTLRDYFAAKAMDGFNKRIVDYGWDDEVLQEHAIQAYRIADAMLKAREQQ